MPNAAKPKLIVTGFGPFPGAPENPTEALVKALARDPAESFGASAFKAVVLPTDYRRSWAALRRRYTSFAPDIVVHFGLNSGAEAIHLECVGRNAVDPAKPDVSGSAPASGKLSMTGPGTIAATFPASEILAALKKTGVPAALSDDAGDYVCNATLYRSLLAAPEAQRVGFVHMPPVAHMRSDRALAAARIILNVAVEAQL